MEQTKKSAFKLSTFTVMESHILRNPSKMQDVKVDIKPTALLNRGKRNFTLFLEVHVKDNDSFDIRINCLGSFTFKSDISEQEMSGYFLTNAPALMFPYVRAYISAMTALSGLPAINLPVMNLSSLKEKLRDNITEVSSSKEDKMLN